MDSKERDTSGSLASVDAPFVSKAFETETNHSLVEGLVSDPASLFHAIDTLCHRLLGRG